MDKHPVLYSYRRCPYAMRTRMAIYLSGIQVEQREIVFWDKPEAMLQASPKGTVPVLVLPDAQVIDESRDIMFWALTESGSRAIEWFSEDKRASVELWIERNDTEFKYWLDRYKYADRFPEQTQAYYREQGEKFLQQLEKQLLNDSFLLGSEMSMADLAVFPFVRQFVNVDKPWFASADYSALKKWLNVFLESEFFKAIMKNHPVWEPGHKALWVDEPELQTKNQFREKAEGKI